MQLSQAYAKCVRIHIYWEIFNKMHDASIDLWNALILGYKINCCNKDDKKWMRNLDIIPWRSKMYEESQQITMKLDNIP